MTPEGAFCITIFGFLALCLMMFGAHGPKSKNPGKGRRHNKH